MSSILTPKPLPHSTKRGSLRPSTVTPSPNQRADASMRSRFEFASVQTVTWCTRDEGCVTRAAKRRHAASGSDRTAAAAEEEEEKAGEDARAEDDAGESADEDEREREAPAAAKAK
jgi:hypothetical protein